MIRSEKPEFCPNCFEERYYSVEDDGVLFYSCGSWYSLNGFLYVSPLCEHKARIAELEQEVVELKSLINIRQ